MSPREIILALKAKTKPSDRGCWEWQGTIHRVGYGTVPAVFGGGRYAHRAMFAAAVAPIPRGMYVLHTCDNRKCINPEHLFVGTHLDNIRDMDAKGRHRGGSLPNESNPSCKFSDEVISTIRRDRMNGSSLRMLIRQYGISETHLLRVLRGNARSSDHLRT